jgi:5-deoxy-glucuronate isomerase
MAQYTHQNLLVRPGSSSDPDVVVEVTPALAGWEYVGFQVRRLASGARWRWHTGENELAIVPLGGCVSVTSGRGEWPVVGGRANVFAGLPHALYLPRRTPFEVTATTGCEFAVAWTPSEQDHPARLVTPAEVPVEIRGGDHATRQINGIIPPGFACHRLVIVEVYTPGGNWSSYPPHKHDVHHEAPDGTIVEADLEEIYYYKFDRAEGFAFQHVYTDPASPLALAGTPIDAVLQPRNDDVVLVPEGYHPVSSPPGYTAYYLNVLAGSVQSLANCEDPRYAWVRQSYQSLDPRVPIYPLPSSSGV